MVVDDFELGNTATTTDNSQISSNDEFEKGVIVAATHPLYLALEDTSGISLISFQLTDTYNFSVCQGTSSVSVYNSKLKDLWDDVEAPVPSPDCDCVKSRNFVVYLHKQKLYQFLMGLNDSYSQAHSQIFMMKPVPYVNQAYVMLVSDENQRAVAATSGNLGPLPNVHAGHYESTTLHGSKPTGSQKFRKNYNIQCEFYKIKGYTMRTAIRSLAIRLTTSTRRKGEHPPLPGNIAGNAAASSALMNQELPQAPLTLTRDQYDQILQFLNKAFCSSSTANVAGISTAFLATDNVQEWIIDTGVTDHMVSDLSLLTSFNTVDPPYSKNVFLPNGDVSYIKHVGTSAISDKSVIKKSASNTMIQDLFNGRVKAIGREDKCLYILPSWSLFTVNKHTAETSLAATQNEDMFAKRTPTNVDLKLWHKRLDVTFREDIFPFQQFSSHKQSVFLDTSSSVLPHIIEQWYAQYASTGSNQNSTAHDSLVLPHATSSSPSSTNSNASSLPAAASPGVKVSQVGSPALWGLVRDKHPPLWMKEFVSLHANQHTPYGLTTYMSYDHLSPHYQSFIASSSSEVELVSYVEAVKDPRWVAAMKFKARLVAKGYSQRESIDYQETFSLVFKMVTIRTILSIDVVQHWHIYQMDVSNAFLQGDLHDEIYMDLPQGFSQHDHSLFIKGSGGVLVLIFVYVDDMLITGSNLALIREAKSFLKYAFTMKDLGELRYFLGIEFARSKQRILMHRRKYTLELISELGPGAAKPVATPLETNARLTIKEFDDYLASPSQGEDKLLFDASSYQRLIGKLLYLTITRPDIAFSVQNLKRITTYCDDDWAACPHSRKSVTGFLVKFGNSLISWKSKKQNTTSRSSAESEYRSLASTTAELTWILGLFKEVGIEVQLLVEVHIDSKTTVQIAANPVLHERTKHIEIDCHFVREKQYKRG
ncbi:uncharacterized protein LOC142168260 [Nicotiana tabacum]|uniref:Uncharacterized protein LOC142168260 n=1 Tax=Nicotiana tabacum TaxID=4097 RepID=A0AC58SJ72_TOBAC